MFAISLTTIPPRFSQLPRVLASLMAQTVTPEAIFVTIPKTYRRFDPVPLPDLPPEVTLIQPDTDPGPIGKLKPAAEIYDANLLICDDDWEYAPDWAELFVTACAAHPEAVIAGSTWDGERIGHPGRTILQGYAGALIPATTARAIPDPPEAAWPVDDIWISGHVPSILPVLSATNRMTPLSAPGALQTLGTRDRDNRAAAALAPWP